LIISNLQKLNGRIEKISVFIGKGPKYNFPFKIQMYSLDQNNSPSVRILNEHLILKATKKNSWVEAYVSQFNLVFENQGLAISFMPVYSKEAEFLHDKKRGLIAYGPNIHVV
jgi:hypothetical protein